jgi:ribosomal protein L11 methyltransferase
MREVILRLPVVALDEVLDRLLPLVPGGVREIPVTGAHMELRIRGHQLPSRKVIREAVSPLPVAIAERSVPDDWRERRLADYTPEPIAGRLVVRPTWAPAAADGLLDIALTEGSAFGVGTHPTTRTCLELLLALEPCGSFADLGCGSGVLAILAHRLGWGPVTALDVSADSVEVARANTERNAVSVELSVVDLLDRPPPPTAGFAANMPAAVHMSVAARWEGENAPVVGLLSGFGSEEADPVLAAYDACGLPVRMRIDRHGWVIAEVGRS